jgi:glycosyltransferase involved in cell wall biosynthesis
MSQADVTIVTPTRNRPPLLERALDSIARQTFQNYEVYVVDDGSSAEHADAYRAIVGRRDARFHLLQPLQPGQTGSGPGVSRNRGMEAGHGRYIAFLDDDDTWTWDDHLKSAIEVLDPTGVDLYCADMQGFSGDVLVFESWFPDSRPLLSGERVRADPPAYRTTRAAFVKAASHRVVHPNMLVVRRQLVERTGGFLNSLRYAEDTEFVLRLADSTPAVLFCPKPVARYRLPEGNAHSLSMSRTFQELQTLAAAQHLRITARSPEVRQAARGIESWTLRLLSEAVKRDGRPGAAVALALQALVVKPTLGAVAQVARAMLPRRGATPQK